MPMLKRRALAIFQTVWPASSARMVCGHCISLPNQRRKRRNLREASQCQGDCNRKSILNIPVFDLVLPESTTIPRLLGDSSWPSGMHVVILGLARDRFVACSCKRRQTLQPLSEPKRANSVRPVNARWVFQIQCPHASFTRRSRVTTTCTDAKRSGTSIYHGWSRCHVRLRMTKARQLLNVCQAGIQKV